MNEISNKSERRKNKRISFGKRKIVLVLIDVACFIMAYAMGVAISIMSPSLDTYTPERYLINAGILLVILLLGRAIFSIYRNVWRYPNVRAYLTIVLSDVIFGAAALVITRLLPHTWQMNIGFTQSFVIIAMFNLGTLTNRFSYQLLHQYLNARENSSMERDLHKIGVAIVGAGQTGIKLAEELFYSSSSHYRPVCFIDRDPGKIGAKVCGLKVLGEDDTIIERLKTLPVQEIFLALPNLSSEEAASMYDFYRNTGCKIKLYEFPLRDAGNVSRKRKLRELHIEDLLFRESLNLNDEAATAYYEDKTILVTGGGGSIGSELCRQIMRCHPKKLIVLDIYENNAYAIQQELLRTYGDHIPMTVEIASVRDVARLDAIFKAYRPQVVFHAAAHKHVPLMEHSACEAIKNNVQGTYNTANMAEKYGAEKFILISTDKAVNPTNIMGASKRMCEMVVQCRTDSKTSFAAVRFGNVLGSNGSVIPLFKDQIEKGGPVTITDKRIIRYFMTIPEASRLVMQAGCMAKSGELFVLNMGKPVRILDLAENMIKLSGLIPYVDIDIVEIGLRPGEKLYEELLIKSETLTATENNLIFIEHDTPYTREEVEGKLALLKNALENSATNLSNKSIKRAMKKAVPTYRDPDEINQNFEDSEEKKLSEAEDLQPAGTASLL